MDRNICSTCMYYRQYYTFDQRKIFRVHCGYCTYSRPKTKRPDSRICENYIQADFVEKAFVTKEYLSKALLEYVLKLELLPEIEDTGDGTKISKK